MLLTVIILFCFLEGKTTHIIGGDISYECTGQNLLTRSTTFAITMWVYRDASSQEVNFDQNFEIGVYRRIGGAWFFDQAVEIQLRSQDSIPIEAINPCLKVPPKLGVYKGLYNFNVTLPFGYDYQIVYQRCCRNATINNILSPQTNGAAFYVYISEKSVETCNNSPVFKNFPPVLICAGSDLNFDHSVGKIEGDSIVYSFCAPATSGGLDGSRGCGGFTPDVKDCPPPFKVVRMIAPYTVEQPMGGEPAVTIDPVTGIIKGRPVIQGQFVIGICVTQFRKGIVMSIMQRDFQFNVSKCEKVFTALTNAKDGSTSQFPVESANAGDTIFVKSCGATDIFFENKSINRTEKTPVYKWIFYKSNNTRDSFSTVDVNYKFPGLGRFHAHLIVNPGQGDCTDTAKIQINITNATKAQFSGSYDSCVYGPMQFFNTSLLGSKQTNILWDLNGEDISRDNNPIINWRLTGRKTIRMIITDENRCVDIAEQSIAYNPIPNNSDLRLDSIIRCSPLELILKPKTDLLDSSYDLKWNFTDGQELTGLSPKLKIEKAGVYSLNLTITSSNKCVKNVIYQNLITVLQSPEAGFTYDFTNVNVLSRKAEFVDTSKFAEFWQWSFGDSGGSTESSPHYIFPDTGIYKIVQIAGRSNGCTDTAFVVFDLSPTDTIFVPDAFTPNEDNLNDEFKIKYFSQSIRTFNMKIYSRYGGLLYSTDNPLQGWNGLLSNGSIAMSDVYIYDIDYVTTRNQKKRQRGHFMLLR